MLKISEFSKLSHLTIKALRFYEKKKILLPSKIDSFTGYRYYETYQLAEAQKIKSYRQIGLTIEEIQKLNNGSNLIEILQNKKCELEKTLKDTSESLSIIKYLMEEKEMKYQVVQKEIPEVIVYYSETILKNYDDIMSWIPSLGKECLELNPGIKCAKMPYEFCEYLDGEYKETNILVRHNEAVDRIGNESENIKFKVLPATKVLSIYHKGPYRNIGEAYAYIMKYAEENNFEVTGLARECYIDGIWNKEDENDWLTEIELPIK